MFCWEFSEISKNIFWRRTSLVAAFCLLLTFLPPWYICIISFNVFQGHSSAKLPTTLNLVSRPWTLFDTSEMPDQYRLFYFLLAFKCSQLLSFTVEILFCALILLIHLIVLVFLLSVLTGVDTSCFRHRNIDYNHTNLGVRKFHVKSKSKTISKCNFSFLIKGGLPPNFLTTTFFILLRVMKRNCRI